MKRTRLFDVCDLVLAGNAFFEANEDKSVMLSLDIGRYSYTVYVHEEITTDYSKMTVYSTMEGTSYEYDPEFIKAEAHIRRLMEDGKNT